MNSELDHHIFAVRARVRRETTDFGERPQSDRRETTDFGERPQTSERDHRVIGAVHRALRAKRKIKNSI